MRFATRRDGLIWTQDDGELFRQIRFDAGKSLRDVAEAAGVSIAYAWDCERGSRAPNRGIVNVYRALAHERQQGAKETSGPGTSESPSEPDRALAGHPDARKGHG